MKICIASGFADGTFCPLTRPPIMRAVWQIISEYTSDIVAINLSSNKLVTFDDSLSIEIKKLKNLRIVYLEDNKVCMNLFTLIYKRIFFPLNALITFPFFLFPLSRSKTLVRLIVSKNQKSRNWN